MIRLILALLCAALFLPAAFAAELISDEIREPAFAQAQEALKAANAGRSNLLAPDAYADGVKAYQRGQVIFEQGGKLARLQRYLDEAVEHFELAAQRAEANRPQLEAVLAARDDADQAGARDAAAETFRDADVAMFEAATRLEAGRDKAAERYQARAESGFREAELVAIEASLLTETERLIAAAEEMDADRFAPAAFGDAVSLLEQARAALAEDRYDTDRPRGLATEALHQAKRARYIATLWQRIDDREVSFEQVIGVWAREIGNLATLLDLAVFFDDGPGDAAAAIGDAITELQLNRGQLTSELSEQRRTSSLLQEEVDRLQLELGGQARARDRLQAELARQQRLKDRVRQVEGLFRPDEAQVLRVEDKLVLRLLALNFDSGKANITGDHETVLGKLMEAVALFPETPIIVEGHTDAYGADLTNLDLSNRRAEAVAQHLLDNSPLSPALLSSIGYGETKPIANNETSDGRRKNRRIDVVLYPNW